MTREEVLSETLHYFNGDTLATDVWINKYCLQDNSGQYLEKTPISMHQRMAREFARIEQKYPNPIREEEIVKLFSSWEIIPQGSVMYGLGNEYKTVSLSNCTVLSSGEYDSYSSILELDQQIVQSAKRRMGYGYDISFLRPRGSFVKNAAHTSTGAVSFLERFSNSTREVAQENRRGASLASIVVHHPDIYEFVTIKNDKTKVTGSNISIKITDDFIQAVQEDTDYILSWNISRLEPFPIFPLPYHTLVPYKDGYLKRVRAKELWNLIIKSARDHSEPGLFLWDRMLNYDPSSVYESLTPLTTNACGEIPQAPGDTCRLIALNFLKCVDNPFTSNAQINYQRLYNLSSKQLRLGDDLVDLEIEYVEKIIQKIQNDPEPDYLKESEIRMWEKVKQQAINGRRVGCGLTGLGDMFAALGIKYGSDESLVVLKTVMKTKMRAELETSIQLSKERGPFKLFNFDQEFDETMHGCNSFYEMIREEYPYFLKQMQMYGRRNVNWSDVSPTGSVSILTQTTSGMEPLFKPYYTRRRKIEQGKVDFVDQNGDNWEEYFVLHPPFKKWVQNYYDHHNMMDGNFNENSLQVLYKLSPWYGSCAEELDYKQRIEVQSIIQKYTSAAISSTLNLPENVSEETVSNIYMLAYEMGLKGVTIYRSLSRSGVLIESKLVTFNEHHAPKRPEILECDVYRFFNDDQKWIAFVGVLEKRPYEIFLGLQSDIVFPEDINHGHIHKMKIDEKNQYHFMKNGVDYGNLAVCFDPVYYNYAKFISSVMRHGMPIPSCIEVLKNMSTNTDSIHTWKNGVIRALKNYVIEGTISKEKCPECHEDLIYQEGCLSCPCGYSRC